MGVGLTMLSLTKAQSALVKKAWIAPVRPYGGEWTTFYRLKSAGVMQYVTSTGNTYVELTPEARNKLSFN